MKAVSAVLAILLFAAAAATAQEVVVDAEVGDQLDGEVGLGGAPRGRM
jgi:hypothetical protein